MSDDLDQLPDDVLGKVILCIFGLCVGAFLVGMAVGR